MNFLQRILLYAGVGMLGALAGSAHLLANPPAVAESESDTQSRDFIRRYGTSAFRERASQLEFSPTDRWLATVEPGSTVRLIDAKTGQTRFTAKAQFSSVTGTMFSPDGRELAVVEHAGVAVWDVREGKLLRRIPEKSPGGNLGRFIRFAGSPDRQWRVNRVFHNQISITRWDQYDPVHEFEFAGESLMLAMGNEGRWMAAVKSNSPVIHAWKAPKFDSAIEWKPSESPIQALAGSTDGESVYAVTKEGAFYRWNIDKDREGTELFKIKPTPIFSLSALPGDKYLAVARWGSVLLYDTATGEAVQAIEAGDVHQSTSLAFSPDGTTLAIGSASRPPIELWDVKTGKRINELVPPIENVFALEDPRRFGTRFYGDIYLWNRDTGRIEESFPINEQGLDGRAISGSSLFRGTEQVTIASREGEVYYRDFAKERSYQCLGRLPSVHPVHRAYSSQRIAATLLGMGCLRLNKFTFSRFEPQPTFRQILKGPAARCLHFGFSANGKTLAAAFADKAVLIWDAESGQERRRLHLDESPRQILLHSNGSRLAVLNVDTVDVWNLAAGKKLHQFPLAKDDHHLMCFGFESGILATAGAKTGIQIWSLETGKVVLALDPPDSAVRCLAFSPDDKQLAAGMGDNTIRLFDLEKKIETASFDAHGGPVTHVLFHPDGKQLVSGSEKWELILWDLSARKSRWTKSILGGIENRYWGAEDRSLMVEDGKRRLFFIRDLEKPSLAHALNEMDVPYERKFAYAKNSGQLAIANSWGIRLLDTKTNRETGFLPDANVRAIEWAEDGRTLMVASGEVFGWDVVEQKEVYRISNAEMGGGVTSLAKSPDGKIVAGGISNQKVFFWELHSGRLIREVSLARKIESPGWWFITSVQFSADGRLLFAMARDMYFVIEVETGLVWFQKPNHEPADTSFALLEDFTLLSAEVQGTARLWSWAPEISPRNGESPERLWRGLTGHDGPTVYHAMFALAELGDDAVRFLSGQLSEIRNPATSPEKIASLIEQLGDPAPSTRRNASEELREQGGLARPQLEKALERENLSARTRSRIQILLAAQDREADPELLALRGVQLLEWIGTPKARELLQQLSTDTSDRMGKEAKAALRRISLPTE